MFTLCATIDIFGVQIQINKLEKKNHNIFVGYRQFICLGKLNLVLSQKTMQKGRGLKVIPQTNP
jgi:hypothetical protein